MRRKGLYAEAWHRLDDLEPIDRVMPDTLALWLLLCADLERWEVGQNVLSVLACAEDGDAQGYLR